MWLIFNGEHEIVSLSHFHAGVPRLSTPPLVTNTSMPGSQDTAIIAPKPIRITPNLVTGLEDLSQPWTRSPTKSKMEPVVATWHFISSDSFHPDNSVLGIFPWIGGYWLNSFWYICWWFPACLHKIFLYIETSLMKQPQILHLSGIPLGLLQCLIHMTWIGDCFWLFKQYK